MPRTDVVSDRYVLARLEREKPEIPWRTPIVLHRFCCRVCIALKGLDIAVREGACPPSREEYEKHMADEHGVTAEHNEALELRGVDLGPDFTPDV